MLRFLTLLRSVATSSLGGEFKSKLGFELIAKITEKMYSYFSKYGFGEKLGVDFIGEASGILMNKDSAKRVSQN